MTDAPLEVSRPTGFKHRVQGQSTYICVFKVVKQLILGANRFCAFIKLEVDGYDEQMDGHS